MYIYIYIYIHVLLYHKLVVTLCSFLSSPNCLGHAWSRDINDLPNLTSFITYINACMLRIKICFTGW